MTTTGATSTGTETSTSTETETSAEIETETETVESLKAALDRQKVETRKQEKRAKENAQAARELETLRASTMSDTEKLVAEARQEGMQDALNRAAGSLVIAEMRAAASGRNLDVDALTDGINTSAFLNDNGEPDRAAIVAWVDKVAPAGEPAPPSPLDLGQGARGGQPPALNNDPLLKALVGKVGDRSRT